jgi:hypothetical protein
MAAAADLGPLLNEIDTCLGGEGSFLKAEADEELGRVRQRRMENQGQLETGMREWARLLYSQKASENPQVGQTELCK